MTYIMQRPNKSHSLVQRVASLSNDLSNLVPVGTLQVGNLPRGIDIGGGISIDQESYRSLQDHHHEDSKVARSVSSKPPVKHELLKRESPHQTSLSDEPDLSQLDSQPPIRAWKWLDLNFLDPATISQSNPLIQDLAFLINMRFCIGTYKIILLRVSRQIQVPLCKIRIFGIPSDLEGARHIGEWRSMQPRSSKLEARYKKAWSHLLCFLDYSQSGWESPPVLPTDLAGPIIDFNGISETTSVSYHISRWKSNAKFDSKRVPESETNGNIKLLNIIQTLYDQLSSPEVSEYVGKKARSSGSNIPHVEDTIIKLVANAKEGTTLVRGINSTLYPFQARSLAKMLEKESIPSRALIPNFVELKAPTSEVYYYDLATNKLYVTPEVYDLPRGGILAENMGLGKTLICLSLICLTNHEVSQIPDNMLLYEAKKAPPKQFPSLTSLCKATIHQNSLPWRYFKKDLPDSIISQLNETSGSFKISLTSSEYESPFVLRTRKASSRQQSLQVNLPEEGRLYKTLLLSNTTLVIVPDNLLNQWNTELRKHVQKDYLKVLFLSNQFKKPIQTSSFVYTNEVFDNPEDFIRYDVIFSTNSFISKSNDEGPNNPFTNIYWKRMIIDEGHTMSSKVSRISALCKAMHSERRWAVTGTPTSGLTRLHMDEQEDSTSNLPTKHAKYTVKNSFNEKDDLTKLGTIVANFLKIEPFHSQAKYWTNQIIKPLEKGSYGSSLNLLNLLRSIIVRHNLSDIESQLQLPQLHHEAVFLEPSYHNKLSVNLFTAVLAVNAVSSERKDVDYMFHPNNAQQLRRLILNLQRATFHWTGFKQEDVELLIEVCEKSMKKNVELGGTVYNDYDLELLIKSVQASKDALKNVRWRTSALLHEMPYFVDGLSQEFVKAFSVGPADGDANIFGAPHLHQIQEFYYKNRFMDMEDKYSLTHKLEAVSGPFWKSYWVDNIKKNNEKFNNQDKTSYLDGDLKNSIRNAVDIPKIVDELEVIKSTSSPSTHGDDKNENFNMQIRNSQILGTASSKLSYLASRLLEHQKSSVKSLVFFEFEDSAYYLTELLDLLGVNYILYATFINSAERARNLAEFSFFDSQTQGGISLIMDLKLASHGLTIIAATHVYFISPVWRRSVEAQAIKRAHRIGQKNEVFVETLVLKGTLEEEIYKRRTRDDDDDLDNQRSMQKRYIIDDTGMQNYILKHEFLHHDKMESEYSPFEAFTSRDYISDAEVDDFSLKEHRDQIVTTDDGQKRKWQVFLFSKNNLAKLNKIKADKVRKDYLRNSVEEDLLEAEAPLNNQILRRKEGAGPPRKKVRF